MELLDLILYALAGIVAIFGGKWGLEAIFKKFSKYSLKSAKVAGEMEEALTVLGNALADGKPDAEEMRRIFTEAKDVWDAIKLFEDKPPATEPTG